MTTPNILLSAIYEALGNLILIALPGVNIVQGLGNGVAMPPSEFIAMTVGTSARLGTNITTGQDNFPSGPGALVLQQNTQIDIQVDFYGVDSADWAKAVQTLMQDAYGYESMPANIKPLYADDPIMIPLVDGESQYEMRWMVKCALEYNPTIQFTQQFFDAATVKVVDVDVTYPPT